MSGGLVERQYGFGAACLPISVEPLLRPLRPLTLREGLGWLRRERRAEGRSRLRRHSAVASLLLGLTLCLALVNARMQESERGLEVVMLSDPAPAPLPAPVARPLPEPAPAAEIVRKVPARPEPVATLRIEAAPEAPPRSAPPPPQAEPARPAVTKKIRIDALAAAVPAPEPLPVAPGWRPAQPAASRTRPVSGVSPLASPLAAAPDPAPLPARGARERIPARATATRTAAPSLSLPGVAAVSLTGPPVGRSERSQGRASGAGPQTAVPDSALQGVPLGSLDSCVSDREEDRLKQRLAAAVTTQKECTSNAGTWHFVETKNLNSFLMWIDRAPHREPADRCAELTYALDCVARLAGRESH